MAVNGFILDQYVGKKVSIILINGGTLEGVLKKDGRKFILDNSRYIKTLTISKIASIKEVDDEQTATTPTAEEIKNTRAKEKVEVGNSSVGVIDNIVFMDLA